TRRCPPSELGGGGDFEPFLLLPLKINSQERLKQRKVHMKLITFLVTGTSPLLMHNPAAMGLGANAGLGAKKIPTPQEEAEAGRYVDGDGNFYFPSQAFKSAAVSGGKGQRIGKQFATGVLKGTIFCTEDTVQILDAKTLKPMKASKYDIDIRRAV